MAFVPPPYPHDRLGPIRAAAAAVPGGILDASVGTPVDPMPAVALEALTAAAPAGTGYPATIGSTVDQLLKRADTPGFRAVELPMRIRGQAPAKVRTVETRNVIGRIEGRRIALSDLSVYQNNS